MSHRLITAHKPYNICRSGPEMASEFYSKVVSWFPIALRIHAKYAVGKTFPSWLPPALQLIPGLSPLCTLLCHLPELLLGPGRGQSLFYAQPVHLLLPKYGAFVFPSTLTIFCLFFTVFLRFFLQGAFPDFQV